MGGAITGCGVVVGGLIARWVVWAGWVVDGARVVGEILPDPTGSVEAGEVAGTGNLVAADPVVSSEPAECFAEEAWAFLPGRARATKPERAPALTMAPTVTRLVARPTRSRP
jgi:hypothetical protein